MSQHAHARALQICQEEGAPRDAAERILRRLLDAGWHWTPPETFTPAPDTGPKASDTVKAEKLAEMRRVIPRRKP